MKLFLKVYIFIFNFNFISFDMKYVATITKIIRENLPNSVKCSNDARDLIQDCCSEFLMMIISEASDICKRDSKKNLNPEHIMQALVELGFEAYLPSVTKVFELYQANLKK